MVWGIARGVPDRNAGKPQIFPMRIEDSLYAGRRGRRPLHGKPERFPMPSEGLAIRPLHFACKDDNISVADIICCMLNGSPLTR